MARTRSSVAAKVSSGKSSKAQAHCSVARPTNAGRSSATNEKAPRGGGGGNPVCPRETPKWQRSITTFFNTGDRGNRETDTGGPGPSKRAPKKNVIQSSDEESSNVSPIKNKELDESIVLETLTGESSHKIDEYYKKGNRGKGEGKKTKKNVKETEDVKLTSETETEHPGSSNVDDTSETEDECASETVTKENEDSDQEDKEQESEKENINNNTRESKKGDECGNIRERKRERDDVKEDGNVSKKVKLQ